METSEEPTPPRPPRAALERAARRALTFLLAVGRDPVARGLLETRGYSAHEHAEGWRLLRAVDPTVKAGGHRDEDGAAARLALARLDAWGHQNLPILDLALRRREPDAHRFLFAGGLAPADGAASARAVAAFLDRVDALVGVASRGVDPAVAVTPRQARVALAILTSRGAGDDVRETVHRWLDFARKHAAPAAEGADPDAALVALHEWLSEWRLIARKVVTRKSHLVALGLVGKGPAKPRATKHA